MPPKQAVFVQNFLVQETSLQRLVLERMTRVKDNGNVLRYSQFSELVAAEIMLSGQIPSRTTKAFILRMAMAILNQKPKPKPRVISLGHKDGEKRYITFLEGRLKHQDDIIRRATARKAEIEDKIARLWRKHERKVMKATNGKKH